VSPLSMDMDVDGVAMVTMSYCMPECCNPMKEDFPSLFTLFDLILIS
jgi:hypothetical protein